jgi:uncharacterized cupin superfamily protein
VSEPLNLYDAAVEGDPSLPAGYRRRTLEFGQSIGATQLGGSLYELDPGDTISPYHYECVEEEWLLVLVGTVTLRDPDGEHELVRGDLVCFPPEPAGAHKVTNRSESLARVLMFATRPSPDISICVYPDSDKVGVWPPGGRYRMSDTLGYWDGEL